MPCGCRVDAAAAVGPPRPVDLDGKVARGSRARDAAAVYFLAALDQASECVLAHRAYPEGFDPPSPLPEATKA